MTNYRWLADVDYKYDSVDMEINEENEVYGGDGGPTAWYTR